jgi:hypothetical protein
VSDLTRTPGSARAGLRWLAFFLIPFVVLAVVHWDWSPRPSAGDFAHYLLHAKAIAEGRPYADVGYLYHPAAGLIGPPTLPPGLPLTLAPLVALGGVHSPLVRLLMLGSVLLGAALATWRLARDVPPWQAAFGAACTAYAIEAALGTIVPLSDPGFAALIWATILAMDREGSWTWRRAILVSALGFAAIAYRTAGIALVPAVLLYAALQRRRLGLLPFLPAALWITAGIGALAAGMVSVPFSERIVSSVSRAGSHFATFVEQYHVAPLEAMLYPFASNLANDVYHAIATIPAVLGMGTLVYRARRSFMISFVAAYCLLLMVAPVAEPRYAWPLFPFVGAGLAYGLTTILRRAFRAWPTRAVAAVAGTALVAVFLTALVTDARKPAPASLVRHPAAVALFDWLSRERAAAAPEVPLRVAFHNPRVVTLETGVPAMGIVPRTPPGILTAFKRSRVSHLIWQGAGLGAPPDSAHVPCVQRLANRLPTLYPAFFTIVYRNATFRVYRFHPPSDLGDDPGEPVSWSEC